MQKITITIISSFLGLSLLSAVPAFAENGMHGFRGDQGVSERGMPMQPENMMQSIMRRGNEMRGLRVEAFAGKVTAASSPNFTLELPRIGPRATTTLTVATNASTTFTLGRNAAMFSDVTVGDFAMVMGSYESSTNTLTALRVNLATSTAGGIRPMMGGENASRWGSVPTSTTPRAIRGFVGSIMQGIRHFFGR
jgi:hypothetical protein